jgi:hypothetical protein
VTGPDADDEPAPDEGWLVLTENLEAYERFRYIARHVLEAALDDARDYADDERLFDVDADDTEATRDHLRRLEACLQEDEELAELERAFLCEAVGAALEERGLEARCYSALVGDDADGCC